MEEIIFRVSEGLERLEVYLYTSSQNGYLLLQSYFESARSLAHGAWSNSSNLHFQESVHYLFQRSKNYCQHIWRLISPIFDPHYLYDCLNSIMESNMHRTSLCFGGLGFLIGGLFGIIVGLTWHHTLPLQQRMKAVVCTGYHGYDSLIFVEDMIMPAITEKDEVLVQVKASSVDYIDIKICSGYGRVLRKQLSRYIYAVKSEFPIVLGRDCSGVITELGQSVSKFEIGDEVWFAVPYWYPGTMSEYVVVREAWIAKKPKGVGFEVAACIPYSGAMAWNAIVNQARLSPETAPGKRILVHSGSSSVGCILVQLAKLWGATVTATCNLRAFPVVQSLGVDDVIVTGHGDVEKKLALREKFDIIFNTVETVTYNTLSKYCNTDGLVITSVATHVASDSYGFIIGPFYSFWNQIKYCIQRIFGSIKWKTVYLNPTTLDNLGSLLEDGSLQPIVDKIFAPQDVELAFQHAVSEDAIGKTIIRFRSHQKLKKKSSLECSRSTISTTNV